MKKIIYGLCIVVAMSATYGSNAQHTYKEEYKTKKPWSHRKKDAVIGAGAGAVTGAIIGHGAKGAVVGGVVGGGAGYIVGRHKDKRHPEPKTAVVYKRKRTY